MLIVLPHLAQGPDCPAYWSATVDCAPQWGQLNEIGMKGLSWMVRWAAGAISQAGPHELRPVI
jgi:hypothetical protein